VRIGSRIIEASVARPKTVVAAMATTTLVLVLLAALPSIWPRVFPFLHAVQVDTDPENMLAKSEPVRVFHDEMKRELSLYDMVVVGVVNETHPHGVFNPTSLSRIYALTEYAQSLRWPDPDRKGETVGVVQPDIIAPSTVDNIEQGGAGTVRFEWLMPRPPTTETEAQAVAAKAIRIPFLRDTLVSSDTKALCLYLPLTSKTLSHRVYDSLRSRAPVLWLWGPVLARIEAMDVPPGAENARAALIERGRKAAHEAPSRQAFIAAIKSAAQAAARELPGAPDVVSKAIAEDEGYPGGDRMYITGLPVAEDTFGVEMFKQMAISAPLAMLVIFLLMLFFFQRLMLILTPMVLAVVCVLSTMGLLIATGNTVHIMSSMIPIFIMPISVLDSVHILSEFFDRYQQTRDRRATILAVMDTLFLPMLYTSLTTASGFASLAITPIPPVQVFGLCVAFGVMLAWVWTVTFVPAYVMLFVSERSLEGFGIEAGRKEEAQSALSRVLGYMGRFTYRHARLIVGASAVLVAVAVLGITRIQVNDNPTKWFTASHPIRVADKVLNEHFAGTYTAYLLLEAGETEQGVADYIRGFEERLGKRANELSDEEPAAVGVFAKVGSEAASAALRAADVGALLDALAAFVNEQMQKAPDDEQYYAWSSAATFVEQEKQRGEVFKQPEALAYIEALQAHLSSIDVVGKSNSLADIVKTVHRELMLGEEAQFVVPATSQAVAQCLITYQGSHRPQDLWHFVTPDFRKANLWVQLKSGDNRDMSRVAESVERFVRDNPPPFGMTHRWFGLTYVNVVWQEKMVVGMMSSFLGSFAVVLLMMILLYRSGLWGVLSMVPLTVTIAFIYGVMGLIGKDYDMPVAVLSSLSLGLAIDYAIHFLSRTRELRRRFGTWKEAAAPVFGEPARAIARNVIVIGAGFLPLLAAPLMPYKTVGIFIATILVAAGIASLLMLPALVTLLESWLFPATRARGVMCMCGTCVLSVAAFVIAIVLNVQFFIRASVATYTGVSVSAIIVLAGTCWLLSRRERCMVQQQPEAGKGDQK
jgi:predicted RND superfamily exporter protein